ncbi:MAG: hypothetical protein GEU79_10580 [Acidimicrobiia bacterium]|nr:hypothetical protein [Acidimicrobiia bacterium]
MDQRPVDVNGQYGTLLLNKGTPVVVVAVDIVDDKVQTVHAISNPDKLQSILDSPKNGINTERTS